MEIVNHDWKTGQLIKTTTSRRIPFLRHFGIIVIEKGQVMVLHNTPSDSSVKEPLTNWQGKRNIIQIYNTQLMELSTDEILDRFEKYCKRPYRLLSYNCEHFVTCMLGMKPKSPQLRRVVVGSLILWMVWNRNS